MFDPSAPASPQSRRRPKPLFRESLFRLAERAITIIKHRPHSIDRRIPFGEVLSILIERFFYALRGLSKTTLGQFRPAILYLGRGVVIKHASMCKFGRGVTLETGVMLNGLAQRGIVLGDHVSIGPHSVIRSGTMSHMGEGLVIGSHSSCDAWCFFGAGGMITIGNYVIMGQHTSLHAETHLHASIEIPIRAQGVLPQPITIEDDCWIGANVTILGGTHIRRGSIVAAGAVVRGSFPPFAVLGGVPARILKSRITRMDPAGA